ncbi:hypothetical protein SRHO_G00302590 [Serrasalmus rhombeus]
MIQRQTIPEQIPNLYPNLFQCQILILFLCWLPELLQCQVLEQLLLCHLLELFFQYQASEKAGCLQPHQEKFSTARQRQKHIGKLNLQVYLCLPLLSGMGRAGLHRRSECD